MMLVKPGFPLVPVQVTGYVQRSPTYVLPLGGAMRVSGGSGVPIAT